MFDRKKFLRALDVTGLTKVESAKVLGVSRATLYLWMNNGSPHERFLLPAIDKACDALLLAVDKKLLPLPRNLTRESRAVKIASMAARLQNIPVTAGA
jgi:hypothetical protein